MCWNKAIKWLVLTAFALTLTECAYEPLEPPAPSAFSICTDCPSEGMVCDTCDAVDVLFFVASADLSLGADKKLFAFLDFYNGDGDVSVADPNQIIHGAGFEHENNRALDRALTGIELVVISESLASGSLAAEAVGLRSRAVPILCQELWCADELGLIGDDPVHTGKSLPGPESIRIRILNSSHPLAAGFTDAVSITESVSGVEALFAFTTEEAPPLKIASLDNSDALQRVVLFAYEKGDTLSGGYEGAPARRVVFCPINTTPEFFNNNGNALLEAAFQWLTEDARAENE